MFGTDVKQDLADCFFQAKDGIRYVAVTGVQTCALPISLASAIVSAAKEKKLALDKPAEFQSVTGQGVRGKIAGRKVAIGTDKFLKSLGVEMKGQAVAALVPEQTAVTLVFVAVDGSAAGVLAVADPIKASNPDAVAP